MSIESTIKAYLPDAEQIAEVALNIAKVMPGAGNIISAIELGIKVANGLANEVPVVMQTWNDIQTAAAGGKPVSDDEWAAWLAKIEDAHTAFLAAVAKVEAGG